MSSSNVTTPVDVAVSKIDSTTANGSSAVSSTATTISSSVTTLAVADTSIRKGRRSMDGRRSVDGKGDVVNDLADGTKITEVDGYVWDDQLKNVRIMVADDSFPILKMISMVLKEHGALITLARDGQEAINHCESVVTAGGNDFHLILTDIQMPNMDGLALIQLVRSMEKELGLEPKIIIGISAFYGDHLAKKTMEAGMDAFLPKPFNYDTFMTVYHDIVQRRKNVAIQTNIVGSNNEEIMAIPGSKSVQQPMVTASGGGARIVPQV